MKSILLGLSFMFLIFNINQSSIEVVGKWSGEDKSEDIGSIIFYDDKYAAIEINGQLFGGKESIVKGKKIQMTYEIDFDKKPVEIDLTLTKLETNEKMNILCIAEFKNQNTMLFGTNMSSSRPTNFNCKYKIELNKSGL